VELSRTFFTGPLRAVALLGLLPGSMTVLRVREADALIGMTDTGYIRDQPRPVKRAPPSQPLTILK